MPNPPFVVSQDFFPKTDIESQVKITRDVNKVYVRTLFTGDVFPSTEAFIVDDFINAVFLAGAKAQTDGFFAPKFGPLNRLTGKNKRFIDQQKIEIFLGKNNKFFAVSSSEGVYSVNEWNKIFIMNRQGVSSSKKMNNKNP